MTVAIVVTSDRGIGNDSGRDDGSRNGGSGGGGDDSDTCRGNDKKVIVGSSSASAKSEDYNNVQKFNINFRLHVKINESSEIPKFFIDIDVFQCETNVMLQLVRFGKHYLMS
jgi:hypothetical protein